MGLVSPSSRPSRPSGVEAPLRRWPVPDTFDTFERGGNVRKGKLVGFPGGVGGGFERKESSSEIVANVTRLEFRWGSIVPSV